MLADQALEEGRHDTALGLYKASLVVAPSASDSGALASATGNGGPPLAREDKGDDSPPVAGAAAAGKGGGWKEQLRAGDCDAEAEPEAGAIGAEKEGVGTVGDALHGVGVALLAAGRFREACRAWER